MYKNYTYRCIKIILGKIQWYFFDNILISLKAFFILQFNYKERRCREMKKGNRNKYKLDYAGYLLFILEKLNNIDNLLSSKIKNNAI